MTGKTIDSVEDVSDWLHQLGYDRFVAQFIEHEIDAEVLFELDINDLTTMQIPIGPAKKILKAITQIPSNVGTELSHQPAAPTFQKKQSTPKRDAERRQVTVMFCDMVGSTSLAAQYDPEDFSTIIVSFLECCTNTAVKYSSHIARYMGDGLLIYFGYPQARENDAERALRVALEMIEDVSALRPLKDLKLSIRIGIATGLVVGGESIGTDSSQESVVMGDTPSLAARLQATAEPNTIFISSKTMKLAGGMFKYKDVGFKKLKGFEKPVQMYKVIGEKILDSRFNSEHMTNLLPMIGRNHELALVLERYAQSCRGDGQVVVITGEAGLGKSRIARAAMDSLPDANHHIVYLQCSSYYVQSALYPIVQYLTHRSGILVTDTPEKSYQRLRKTLIDGGECDEENIGLISQMMGLGQKQHPDAYAMSAQQRRVSLLDTLVKNLLRLSERSPLLVLIEDTHWIDPTTRALFELIIESIESKRVLIITTERPHSNVDFFNSPITSRLVLNRLGRNDVNRMIQGMTHQTPLNDAILAEIANKADGVPLFVEEITKAATEAGQLKKSKASDPLNISIEKLSVPSSLHDSLMERLDRLSVVKEYAQVGSVLGREFEYHLLAATLDRTEEEITTALDQLVETGLLSRVGQPPDALYRFKHSLIRDTAYESMLKRKRQHWHSRVAITIENTFPGIVENEPEILAQHYSNSGFTEKALFYWTKAADLSLEQFTLLEAVEKTSAGLSIADQLERSPERDKLTLKLNVVRALSLRSLNGYTDSDSAVAFENAMVLAKELNDKDRYVSAARGLSVSLYVRGKLAKARELTEQVIAQSSEARHLVDGHLTLGQLLYYQGYPKDSQGHLTKALELVDELNVRTELSRQFDERCAIEQFLQQTLDLTGKPAEAIKVGERSYARASKFQQPLAIAGTLCHLCLTKLRLELPCVEESKELLTLTSDYQMSFWNLWAQFCCAMANTSDPDLAIQEIINVRENLEAMGVKVALTNIMAAEARLLLQTNQMSAALQRIADAKIHIENTGERYYESEIFRLEGDAFRANDQRDLAEKAYRDALKIAEHQKACWWQLQALSSLAVLGTDDTTLPIKLREVASVFVDLDLVVVRNAKQQSMQLQRQLSENGAA